MGDNLVLICSQVDIAPSMPCAIEAAGGGGALVAKTSCRPQRSPSFVAGPGIDEIKAKSLEVADIVGRKLKSMRDRDAGSLQISQLSGNLVDSQSRSARHTKDLCRRFGRGDIERIDARPKSSNGARHSCFERVATPAGFQHGDSSIKFEDDKARYCTVCEAYIEPIHDLSCWRRPQRL
jgi:hypothetical protein